MSYGNYPDLEKVKKILVVKMRHHGDVLLTSPVFHNLRKAIPHATIDAYLYKDTLPMLEGHPCISEFLLYDRAWKKLPFWQKIKQEIILLLRIRKRAYDLVINLTEGDRGAIVSMASKAPYAVGFDSEKRGMFGKNKAYTHVVKTIATPRHTVEKQLDALRCIGIFPEDIDRDLFFRIPEAAGRTILNRLSEASIACKGYVVLHPASRWRFKCPPPRLIADVIESLEERGKKVVLTCAPDEIELQMLDKILSLIPGHQVLNLGGKVSLKELGALIAEAELLICVDSVPLHMASALKTPVVALFGPSSDLNWGPWMHPQSRVVAKKISCRPCFKDGCGGSKMSDCLYTLSVKEVMEAVDSLSIATFSGFIN